MTNKCLSVIVQAYNESNTILDIIQKVAGLVIPGIELEIMIVNDHSTDDTRALVEKFMAEHSDKNIKLLNQEKNQGKGAAIQRGVDKASGEYLVIQDADLEYDPEDYRDQPKPMLSGRTDVVYGSRFMGQKPHLEGWFPCHFLHVQIQHFQQEDIY